MKLVGEDCDVSQILQASYSFAMHLTTLTPRMDIGWQLTANDKDQIQPLQRT
jgi:hypothetical protein